MAIRVYLRASTKEQNAERAKTTIDDCLTSLGTKADFYYVENVSGTTLNRPELLRLMADSEPNDILVVEQVDRLTRLTANDWKVLKRTIEDKKIHLVALDLPTSWKVIEDDDSFTGVVLKAVNGLILELLATTARKDYEDRRRRQAEGIAIAKAEGKFTGRKQSQATIDKCIKAIKLINAGETKQSAAKDLGIGIATLYRYIKDNNIEV